MSMFSRFKYKGGNLAGLGASLGGSMFDNLIEQAKRLTALTQNIRDFLDTAGSSITSQQRAAYQNLLARRTNQLTATLNAINKINSYGNKQVQQHQQAYRRPMTTAEQMISRGIQVQLETGENNAGGSSSAFGGEY